MFPLASKQYIRFAVGDGDFEKIGILFLKSHRSAKSPDQGILKGGSITVPLTSCLTGLESAVWQLTTFVFICKTDESKPVKQEVSRTVIRPPLVFPGQTHIACVHESLGHSHMRFGSSDFTELCDFDRNPPIFSNHHRW